MVSQHHYGCSNARNRGETVCTNMLVIRRDKLEETVLTGLRTQLMEPELVKEFIAEFHAEMNRLMRQQDAENVRREQELESVDRQLRNIMDAIKAGMFQPSMKVEVDTLEARKLTLDTAIAGTPPPQPRLHPNLAELYRQKVAALREALNGDDGRHEAAEILRSLIDEVRLLPDEGKLAILLRGHLAEILSLGNQSKNPRRNDAAGVQATLVAGIGFEPMTFRL